MIERVEKVAVTSLVLSVPSASFRYIPVVSPSSVVPIARNDGLSNVNVATPVVPSRERVSFTSGTTGSGTPTMNSMKALGGGANLELAQFSENRLGACHQCAGGWLEECGNAQGDADAPGRVCPGALVCARDPNVVEDETAFVMQSHSKARHTSPNVPRSNATAAPGGLLPPPPAAAGSNLKGAVDIHSIVPSGAGGGAAPEEALKPTLGPDFDDEDEVPPLL